MNIQEVFPISLGTDQVAIQQKKNICKSRLDVNIQSEIIKGVVRPTPFIASNMSTVCDSNFCIKLFECGALGVLHRAAPEDFLCQETKKISEHCEHVAVSIGINESDKTLCKNLIKNGANIIFIDIAHGYSDDVFNMARWIKNEFSDKIKVVIGNTTNTNILGECTSFVDAVKVGIAQGLACETKNTAGCTEKNFSSIYKFRGVNTYFSMPLIADGGVREPADVVKLIGAGAASVMAGSIFARCPESAAQTTTIDGQVKKVYAGMASRFVQEQWKGGLKDGTCPEGGIRYLNIGESVEKLIERYSGALKSGITYAGGKDIKSFQESVEFVRLV